MAQTNGSFTVIVSTMGFVSFTEAAFNVFMTPFLYNRWLILIGLNSFFIYLKISYGVETESQRNLNKLAVLFATLPLMLRQLHLVL